MRGNMAYRSADERGSTMRRRGGRMMGITEETGR